MARSVSFTDEEVAKARQLRDTASTVRDLRQALSILLVAEAGLDASRTSELLGISERTVFRNRGNLHDAQGRRRNTWGGRRHFSMTLEEEREFLQPWEVRAMEGGVLSVPPIHAALVAKLGHAIPMSTTYRLLARHGWRKVHPDTKHPKSDRGVQEDFKKTSRVCGGRLCEEREEAPGPFDVPGRGTLWAHELSAGLLGANTPQAYGQASTRPGVQV